MTLKGDAGFKYTLPGPVTVTVPLEMPLRAIHTLDRGVRFEQWNILGSARDVIEVAGSRIREIWAAVRFHRDLAALQDLVYYGLNDTALSYFPSLAVPGTSFPCKLVAVATATGDAVEFPLDSARFAFAEFELRFRLRRVDGGTFNALLVA